MLQIRKKLFQIIKIVSLFSYGKMKEYSSQSDFIMIHFNYFVIDITYYLS